MITFAAMMFASMATSNRLKVDTFYSEEPWKFTRRDKPLGMEAPIPLLSGGPMIQPKGMVMAGGYIYIVDTGKDENHKLPASVWRFDPDSGKVKLFFRGKPLVNSKWLFHVPGKKGRNDELVFADYGEQNKLRAAGTGKGAKVFAIPILPNGNAGKPRILHQGPPLAGPEGITVIGDTVLVTDYFAGPLTSRPEDPTFKFHSGALFAIPLSGGKPKHLLPDHKWTTLIVVCGYPELDLPYVMLIDLDSGRPNKGSSAAIRQSGTPEFFRLDITSKRPFKVGKLHRVPITEDGTVKRSEIEAIAELNRGPSVDQIEVEGLGRTEIINDYRRVSAARNFALPTFQPQPNLWVRSDQSAKEVTLRIVSKDSAGNIISTRDFILPKDPNNVGPMADNKHAGARIGSDLRPYIVTADATTHSVHTFPAVGGTPVPLFLGNKNNEPIAVLFSEDKEIVYITDQAGGPNRTGIIWKLKMPRPGNIEPMFPSGKTLGDW